jgi:hypothetical protein
MKLVMDARHHVTEHKVDPPSMQQPVKEASPQTLLVREILTKRKRLTEEANTLREKRRKFTVSTRVLDGVMPGLPLELKEEICTFSMITKPILQGEVNAAEARLNTFGTTIFPGSFSQYLLYPLGCGEPAGLVELKRLIKNTRERLWEGDYGDCDTKTTVSRATALRKLAGLECSLRLRISLTYQVKAPHVTTFYYHWLNYEGEDGRPLHRRVGDLALVRDVWQNIGLFLTYLNVNTLCCTSTQFLCLFYSFPTESNKFVVLL